MNSHSNSHTQLPTSVNIDNHNLARNSIMHKNTLSHSIALLSILTTTISLASTIPAIADSTQKTPVFQVAQRSKPQTLTATISTRGEVATTIFKATNGSTYQILDVNSSGKITRTRQATVSVNGNFIQMKSTDGSQDVYRGIIAGNRIENGIWYNPNDPVWFGNWTATLEY